MSEPMIAELKADYPVFVIKNKHNIAKELLLANGESTIVPERGIAHINSADINSFPDFSTFQFISPDIGTLADYGIIKRTESPAPAATPSKTETFDPKPSTPAK